MGGGIGGYRGRGGMDWGLILSCLVIGGELVRISLEWILVYGFSR